MTVGYIATSLMMQGPTGIMVPLYIENFVPANEATMWYAYIATILLLLIAATTGSRGEPAYCALIPIFAGMFTFFGWFKFPNMANSVAMMVICGVFGIMIYMNETNHDRNGIAGPGSKLLNIVFFIILFQTILGVMPAFGIFDASATAGTSYGQAYCPPSANCGTYSNVDISQAMSVVADGNGFLSGVASVVYGSVTAFIAMLYFIVTAIVSVLLSATVIGHIVEGIWPGVTSTVPFIAFMGIVSVIFWACDLIFISNVYLKLFPSEGSI